MYFWENTLFRGRTNPKPMDTCLWLWFFLGIISFFMSSTLLPTKQLWKKSLSWRLLLESRVWCNEKSTLCEDKNCVTCQSFFTPYSTKSKSLEMLFRKLPSLKHANNQSCHAKLLMTRGQGYLSVSELGTFILKIKTSSIFTPRKK